MSAGSRHSSRLHIGGDLRILFFFFFFLTELIRILLQVKRKTALGESGQERQGERMKRNQETEERGEWKKGV